MLSILTVVAAVLLGSGVALAAVLDGTANADTINGLGGSDTINGKEAADKIDGGDGGDALLQGSYGNDTVQGGAGADRIHGGPDDDTLWQGPLNEANDDRLEGDLGNDTIISGNVPFAKDTVVCEEGTDTAWVDPLDDVAADCERKYVGYQGTGDDDTIDGGAGDDKAWGHGGDDTINGLAGTDTLDGHDGKDSLDGGDGDDKLLGYIGEDNIVGGLGADTMHGGEGNDLVVQGPMDDPNVDSLNGDLGDDILDAASAPASRDVVNCGAGTDSATVDALDTVNADCETVEVIDPNEVTAPSVEPVPDEQAIPDEQVLTEQQAAEEQDLALNGVEALETGGSFYSPHPYATYAYYNSRVGGIRVRWGTTEWGYRHIRNKHGYNATFILRTVNHGSWHREGTSSIYNRYIYSTPTHHRMHKVVYQNAIQSDGGTKGVITAYYWWKGRCSPGC